ncbi:MAG: DALR domain-containing protein, partial [Myxococcota bacterium]
IHGGGRDLIFPHHENEIAQSEAATGKTLARYWAHNGFVNIDNEKMSKSLGNFFTIREVLERFDAQALRYYLLTTHYRSPINFSDAGLREAEARVKYLYETLARLRVVVLHQGPGPDDGPYREPWVGEMQARFDEAMDDDFNTAKAIGDLSEAFRLANEILAQPTRDERDERTLRVIDSKLREIGSVLGLFEEPAALVLERLARRRQASLGLDAQAIEALIGERVAARKSRDFARADAIRDELAHKGIVLHDGPQGTTWEAG